MSSPSPQHPLAWYQALALRAALSAMLLVSSTAGAEAGVRLLSVMETIVGSTLQPTEKLNRYHQEQRESTSIPFSEWGHTPIAAESAPRRLVITEAHRAKVVGPNRAWQGSPPDHGAVPATGHFTAPFSWISVAPTTSLTIRDLPGSLALSGARTAHFCCAGL
ncbi:hypothetical protein GC173_14850 [bacterium]|nr:hypothetical protein [bacterium]